MNHSAHRRPFARPFRNAPARPISNSSPKRSLNGEPLAPRSPAPPAELALDTTAFDASASFADLGLSTALLRAIQGEGYEAPTPVQAQVVPLVLSRRDVLACAQTGTGKTAAFVLPILQLLGASELPPGPVRALILSPTRELASQIAERCAAYGRFTGIGHATIYGGVSPARQISALRQKPGIVVATPGRLLDLLDQRHLDLRQVQYFVLDEGDRMLDMGFIRDVRRIAGQLPRERQTLLFSATMPREIEALAQSLLKNAARVSVTPEATTAVTIEQAVVYVERDRKLALLTQMLEDRSVERVLVFTRTKRASDRLSKQLRLAGIDSTAINGNKSQAARERALSAFRRGRARVLVATDVAARGIDVDGISHVINFDLPEVAESYVHRVGRTGRAGATGRAISFCGRDERPLLTGIERLLRRRLTVMGAAPVPVPAARAPVPAQSTSAQSRS